MEVQLTDFENAAFSVFIVLLTRAILSFNLNFYMPISQVSFLPCNPSVTAAADEIAGRREHAPCSEAQCSPGRDLLLPEMDLPVGQDTFPCGLSQPFDLPEWIQDRKRFP